MDLNFALQFELCDPPQILAEDFRLDFELMLVVGVLVVASATVGEVRAWRRDAVWRWRYYFAGVGAGEAGFFLGESGFDCFSG
jgi:hypothetical protein